MPDFLLSRRSRSGLLAGIALGVLTLFPIAYGSLSPAQAQVSVSIDFRAALEPYGAWRSHPRWGEVWVPARRARDWRPYQIGHWVYTDEWGWYWISDEDEADWGWVAYHYCRWVFDRGYGWVCVPGGEWAPAWVDWRRGDDYVGWAPLPPDEVIFETRDDPQYWVFVRQRDLIAPRVRTVFLSSQQRTVYFQRTVVVNRTVVIDSRGHRIAVNPGIPPAYIAAASRHPLPTFQVRPRVFAGTRGVEGGVEIRAEELRGRGGAGPRGLDRARAPEAVVQRTSTVIQPAASVPPPQPLGRDEKGRLGTTPPKAAQGAGQPAAPQPPAGARPTQPAGERPAAPAGERPATPPPPPQAAPPPVTPPPPPQAAPRPEPARPAPPPQAAPRLEPPRPAAPPPQAAPPPVTPPPPPQATPRLEPQRPAASPPQAAPRPEPARPAAPPQTAPRPEPPRPTAPPPQAAPPKPAAPAQPEKAAPAQPEKKDKKGSE